MNLFRRPVHPSNWISAWIDRAAKRKLLGKNGNVRVKVDENRWSGGVNRETTGLKRAFKLHPARLARQAFLHFTVLRRIIRP